MVTAILEQQRPMRAATRPNVRGGPKANAAGPSKALVDALSIVVHDLRGPLANLHVILDLIETYSERQALAELPACSRRAQHIVEALDRMLGSFLERTRLTGDPLAFHPAMFDLTDAIDTAVQLNQPLAEARSITVERRGLLPVTLEGDRQLMLEAVDNVLSNAIKYSPAGSVVELTSGIDGSDAVVSIADSGSGLSAGEVAGLFRPFVRLSKRKPEMGPSTGLGLWIARLIATRHGGTLTVRSRDHAAGSIFTFRIPRWR